MSQQTIEDLRAAEAKPLCFEPHGGYGQKHPIEDEQWPFGYISYDGPIRDPIFELNAMFDRPAREMLDIALLLASAPDLRESVTDLVALIDKVAPEYSESPVVSNARIALAKVDGRASLVGETAEG